mmetsp:Transcript_24329/g.35662  ORF Transcript_24329/g.35662 Transcript_24329/m.35662 type:complete len:290 (+) Transcript_24329:57-926(+)
MSSSDNFTFVCIPANDEESLRELSGPLSGGLENDSVQKYAKSHLMSDMVNICSLGLPSPTCGYIGVSLYSHIEGADSGLPANKRATDIAQACGHKSVVVYGDAFLSRYYDNEDEEWSRRDLSIAEASPDAEWVAYVASMNKGKNMNSYTTGGSLQQMLSQQAPQQQHTQAETVPTAAMAEGPISWTQTGDEIEVRVEIGEGVKAKDVKVDIRPSSIAVYLPDALDTQDEVASEAKKLSLLNICKAEGAKLFSTIHADESTWSVDTEHGSKSIVLFLVKTSYAEWPYLCQ